MADTRRTVAALLVLWADNATGDVSPQDGRDWMVSTSPAYGSLYWATPAETTVAAVDTPVKASGTTASVAASSDVTVATTNRLTYTGAPTLSAKVWANITMTAAANNKLVSLHIAKNGSVIASAEMRRTVGTGADYGNMGTHTIVSLAQNDYVEIWVENETDAVNITVQTGVFSLETIFI